MEWVKSNPIAKLKLQLYFKRSHILPYTGLLLILLFDHICVVLRKTFYKIHFPFFIFLTQLTDLRNEISHVLISICTFAVVVMCPSRIFYCKSIYWSDFKTSILQLCQWCLNFEFSFFSTGFHFLCLVTFSSSSVEHWVNRGGPGGWVTGEEVFPHEYKKERLTHNISTSA